MQQDRIPFLIYNASAGAGKTHTLVREYLKIVLSSPQIDAYRQILAITFTNKAVNEMKSRIVGTLSEMASGAPSAKTEKLVSEIAADLQVQEAALYERSKKILQFLLHNYAAFDISTIDKFTHRVIRSFARDLNLPMNFEVTLDQDALLQEAVDAVIAQAGSDELLTQILVDFAIEQADEDRQWNIAWELYRIGKLITNEEHIERIADLSNYPLENLNQLGKKLKAKLREQNQAIRALAQEGFAEITQRNIPAQAFSRSLVYEWFAGWAQGAKEAKPTIANYLTDPKKNMLGSKATVEQREAVQEIAPRLLALGEQINQLIVESTMAEQFAKYFTPLSLVKKLSEELKRIQLEQNVVSLSDFNTLIHNEIKDQPAPFIYERLGERYRHYFIDEFQDTSVLQWQNLIPLIGNALSGQDNYGTPGSLLIVGDPKQSIYRWRGGKAEQFIRLSNAEHPFDNIEIQPVDLGTNYRSYDQVIEFNNAFFQFVSSNFSNQDYANLYFNTAPQLSNSKKGGMVSVQFVIDQKSEEIDFDDINDANQDQLKAVEERIYTLQDQGFSLGEIVILTRNNNEGIWIAEYLSSKKIPIISAQSLILNASAEVRFIIDSLRYALNSADSPAKARTLYYIGHRLGKNEEISDFMQAGMQHKNDNDFSQWIREFGYEFSYDQLRKTSLYEAVEILVRLFIPTYDAYVQHLLDVVLECDMSHLNGLADFIAYWDRKKETLSIPIPEGQNAVRILTVHKSKGLEFPVVIYPFVNGFEKTLDDYLWANWDGADQAAPRLMYKAVTKLKNVGEQQELEISQKAEENLLDDMNILYVAFTRAEEQLHIISTTKVSARGNVNNRFRFNRFLRDFIASRGLDSTNGTYFEFGFAERKSTPHSNWDGIQSLPVLRDTLPMSGVKVAQREAMLWGSAKEQAIKFGTELHEILSWISSRDTVELALEQAVLRGILIQDQVSSIRSLILEVVNHLVLAKQFSPEVRVLNEQAIIVPQQGVVKPDRIALFPDGTVCLLDYKTGGEQSKYADQLNRYANYLQEMGYIVIEKAIVYISQPINIIFL